MIMAPIMLVLLLFVGVLIAAAASLRGSRKAKVKEPVCGRCGYSTVGLDGLTCPECGGDFRSVGILTPLTPLARGPGFVGGIFFLSILLFILGLLVGGGYYSLLPQRARIQKGMTLSSPTSGQYQSVSLNVEGSWWEGASKQPRFPVLIELRPKTGSSTHAPLRVNPPSGNSRPAAASQDEVLTWFKNAGIDTSRPEVAEEAARIAAATRQLGRIRSMPIGRGGYGQSSRSSMGSSIGFNNETRNESVNASPPTAALYAIGLFWFLLFATSIRRLWRLR